MTNHHPLFCFPVNYKSGCQFFASSGVHSLLFVHGGSRMGATVPKAGRKEIHMY